MAQDGELAIALIHPDQAGNVGTIARLAACLGVGLHVVEPCGFLWDDKRLRRAGMDYLAKTTIHRHDAWPSFHRTMRGSSVPARRLVLLSTHAVTRFDRFAFAKGDVLLLGSESAGVSDTVRRQTDAQIRIPMRKGARSLNVAVAAAMVLATAAAAIGLFDEIETDRTR